MFVQYIIDSEVFALPNRAYEDADGVEMTMPEKACSNIKLPLLQLSNRRNNTTALSFVMDGQRMLSVAEHTPSIYDRAVAKPTACPLSGAKEYYGYVGDEYRTRKKKNNKETDIMINSVINEYKNKAIKQAIQMAGDKVKSKFGIEIVVNGADFDAITEFLKKYDKNINRHVQNPMPNGITDQRRYLNIIEKPFIVKLQNDTFVYFNRFSRSDDEGCMYDKMTIYIFGKKSYKYYRILSKYLAKGGPKIGMRSYMITSDGKDGSFKVTASNGNSRSMDTLYFDDGIKNKIINHLNEWKANEDVYKDRGIIYKTGILLHGTAGTGKSTLTTAIADYLGCALVNIDCTGFHNLNISELTASINADTCQYVILLDEIDSIFVDRDDMKMSKKERTSKLLSFLDGPTSPTNVVFVATTNYIDKLDKATLRKGRFDLIVELTDIHEKAAINMCKGFKLKDSEINTVLERVEQFPVNPSTLQSIILEVKAGKDIEEV